MRWLLVAILGYACLILETAAFRPGGLAVPIDGHWAWPDLALVLGLFLALSLGPREMFVVGWCLGLGTDFAIVSGRPGVQALEFGLALAGLSYLRGFFNRRSVSAQLILTLAAVTVTRLVWYVATRLLAGAPAAILRSVEQAAFDALYSAILAPYLFWLLERLRGPLGVGVEMPQR